MSPDDRQNEDALYNKMTLADIRRNFTEPTATDPVQVTISFGSAGVGAKALKTYLFTQFSRRTCFPKKCLRALPPPRAVATALNWHMILKVNDRQNLTVPREAHLFLVLKVRCLY